VIRDRYHISCYSGVVSLVSSRRSIVVRFIRLFFGEVFREWCSESSSVGKSSKGIALVKDMSSTAQPGNKIRRKLKGGIGPFVLRSKSGVRFTYLYSGLRRQVLQQHETGAIEVAYSLAPTLRSAS
jgi:hypothetical protein